MNPTTLGVACALTLTAGVLLIVDYVQRGRRITLSDRIAGHFGAAPMGGALSPGRLRRWARRSRPGDTALAERLRRAGRVPDVGAFRQGDLILALTGAALAAAVIALASLRSTVPVGSALALLAIGAVSGVWIRRELLRTQSRRRVNNMAAAFPAFAELLALAVAAGDAVGPALRRCAKGVSGDLGDELAHLSAELGQGVPSTTALEHLARRVDVPSLRSCVDAISVASERGTPLASVLRDQAADAREARRRELIETAGKKEVSMLIPVVFGVLPLSVLFAVYPSIELLNLQL